MKKQFSISQLAELRTGFSKIGTVNPDKLKDVHVIFEKCRDEGLAQLAAANIRFLSLLAKNEISRRAERKLQLN